MALGMNLNQLKAIYRIQFPVLKQYEEDTWYDANGRIVFTNNRSLSNVGFERKVWETKIIDMFAGEKAINIIHDDTHSSGAFERKTEYVAPFIKCNREKEYDEIWSTFEERFKHK